jgi:hypothetical protein
VQPRNQRRIHDEVGAHRTADSFHRSLPYAECRPLCVGAGAPKNPHAVGFEGS